MMWFTRIRDLEGTEIDWPMEGRCLESIEMCSLYGACGIRFGKDVLGKAIEQWLQVSPSIVTAMQ